MASNYTDLHQQTDAHIAEVGCTVILVGSGPCACDGCTNGTKGVDVPFAYTVGLHTIDRPEVILFAAFAPEVAQGICNNVAARLREDPQVELADGLLLEAVLGKGFAAKVRLLGRLGQFADTHERDGLFGYLTRYAEARGRAPGEIEVMQILWPDKEGVFPDEPGYSIDPAVQPLIRGAREQ